MKETQVTLPELGLIAGTRGILGAGLGLLLADHLSDGQRKAVGWTLFLTGAISTVPIALEIFGKRCLISASKTDEQRMSEKPE